MRTYNFKEKFYDENINLKTIINSIIKDNSIYKSEIHKLEVNIFIIYSAWTQSKRQNVGWNK